MQGRKRIKHLTARGLQGQFVHGMPTCGRARPLPDDEATVMAVAQTNCPRCLEIHQEKVQRRELRNFRMEPAGARAPLKRDRVHAGVRPQLTKLA